MFVEYVQNNSGGDFVLDENVTHYVYIEADSVSEANNKAEDIGIYFGGLGDCPCCGDRWTRASDKWDIKENLEDFYAFNSDSVFNWMPKGKEVVVHYKDGTKVWS